MADDDQGAIPTDNTPPPAAATGQDTFGGGAVPTGNDQTFGGGANPTPTQGPNPQQLKQYIQGAGAMPVNDYEVVRQRYIDQGVDPNDATAKTVVEGGPRAMQAARHIYDASRGAVAKQIQDGNLDLAAQSANKAFENVPEGSKAHVTVGDNKNFNISLHLPNGDIKNDTLSPEEMTSTFSGKNGFFDHVAGQGIATAISRGKNLAAGGPTSGGEAIPGPPPASSFPGNQAPAPSAPGPGQAPVVGGAPGVGLERTNISKTLSQPGGPVTGGTEGEGGSNLPPGATVTDPKTGRTTQLPPGYTVVKDKAGDQHVVPPGRQFDQNTGLIYSKPGSEVYGMPGEDNGPINVTRGGVTTQVGNTNVGTPEQRTMAQQIHPNNPQGQAQWIANQNEQRQKQENAVEVAKNQRLYGNQTLADSRKTAAEIKANAPQRPGTSQGDLNTRNDERLKSQQNARFMRQKQFYLGRGDNEDQASAKAVRDLTTPGQEQPAQQRSATPAGKLPPEAAKMLQQGHITTFGNGQRWTLGPDGQPQQVQ